MYDLSDHGRLAYLYVFRNDKDFRKGLLRRIRLLTSNCTICAAANARTARLSAMRSAYRRRGGRY